MCVTLCAPFLAESPITPHPTTPTFPIALCVHSPGLPEIVTFCCNSDCHVARSSGQPIKCRSSFAKRTRFEPFLIKILRSQISIRFCPWKSFVCSTVPLLCTKQPKPTFLLYSFALFALRLSWPCGGQVLLNNSMDPTFSKVHF